MKPWRGVWPAIKPGSKCLQYDPLTQASLQGDEDCLYLNVYSPMVCTANASIFSILHAGELWAILQPLVSRLPITVAVRSKEWTVFARSIAGITGWNPTQGMDVCVHLFCVCVVLCVGLRNWKSGQGPTKKDCSAIDRQTDRHRQIDR
jgi:hypothetical protein